ncbi:hypothetical protein [Alloactinosynnema sp. L-07]|uniref:hypothetical protein n=1 Tax=Alloactinosynnema sp. L-07 TaxID=1653480 RepID=UPI00065F05E6|nr:hypothetical protein [Alloactinosynnema sp. L-07]CRK58549.1 hypothetical protein [Alloactinosynnema sp. L-07]
MRFQRAAVGAISLAVVGGGIATVAMLAPADDGRTPVSALPQPTATRPADRAAPRTPGWQVITDPTAAITYEVPPTWTLAENSESLESSSGVELGHLADFGPYLCQGAEYGRAFSGSGLTDGTTRDSAAELAAAVAADQYSDGSQTAKVTLSNPTRITRDGLNGTIVHAAAEVTADDIADRCASTKGTVVVVALTTKAGTSVVVLAADADTGSTPSAPLVTYEEVTAIAESVRPSG